MMTKYSERESVRIRFAYDSTEEIFQSKKAQMYRRTIEPNHLYIMDDLSDNEDDDDATEGYSNAQMSSLFIDNKIDVDGKRFPIELTACELNNLLLRLANYIECFQGSTQDEKVEKSAIYRLHTCWIRCRNRFNDSFYTWLSRIGSHLSDLRAEAVAGMTPDKPSIIELRSGILFEEDISKARELVQRKFFYFKKAVVLGIKLCARGPSCSLRFNEITKEIDSNSKYKVNNLKRNWAERYHSKSWAKYYIKADEDNEKCCYGQVNYFFRFTTYQDDDYISNLAIASVCTRKVKMKYAAKPNISKMAIPVISLAIEEEDTIDERILFVPLREFVSTGVATVGFDINKKPILPTNYNKSHIMTKESKAHLSKENSIHISELYLIDLCPSRRKLIVGVDSQIADNENDIVANI
jgi:hypothetical protein